MSQFTEMVNPTAGMSILDLGGTASIWESVATPLDLTLLNLEYDLELMKAPSIHSIRHLVGDACNVTAFADWSFDFVFSNSVIEHVGDAGKRSEFAREARRLGKAYWIQTPSKWFPIEAHCGMPFWWFYPKWLRSALIASWQKKLPDWTRMIEGTDVLSRTEICRLFPEATVLVERVMGVPKSYVAYYSPRPVSLL